jgi:hypothetical protein
MKNLEKARDILNEKIALFNAVKPKVSPKEVAQLMHDKYNVDHGRTIGIFNHFELVEDLPYEMLYKFMQCIREVALNRWTELDASGLHPSLYFSELEEKEYGKPVPAKAKDFDLVFEDWHKTEMGQYLYYTIHTDANKLQTIRNYNKFRYNPETQRDFLIIETGGIPIVKPDIKQEAIDSMMESMEDGSYFPVPLIVNINPLENEESVIERGKKLIFPQKIKLDLIEGFHNYRAITSVKDKNQDWNMPVEIRVVFKNVNGANLIIDQMNKKNHFTEKQEARINSNSKINYFIDELNASKSFKLKGKIDNDIRFYLYKLLPKMYEIKDIKEADEYKDEIENYLNYVVKKTNHYDEAFTESEWFILLYTIKKASIFNIDFEDIFDKIDYESLLDSIKIVDDPKKRHYDIIDKKLEEVKNNAVG